MEMLWWLIPSILIAISAVLIVVVLVRKIPQLRVIDVESIPEEKAKHLKQQIILKRFNRFQSEKLSGFSKATKVVMRAIFRLGRRIVQKLYAIEEYYKKIQQHSDATHAVDKESMKKMLKEAEKLVQQEEYIPAEKKYIEVISHHPKYVPAYEGLGNLYLKNKNYEQARETLYFILRMSPNDASVHMSLAEVEMAVDNYRKAVKHLQNAVKKRPKNPKYLDAYIESALNAKIEEDAEKGMRLLRAVNPENTKFADWEKRLEEIDGDVSKTQVKEEKTKESVEATNDRLKEDGDVGTDPRVRPEETKDTKPKKEDNETSSEG